jgi:hypothetical protein
LIDASLCRRIKSLSPKGLGLSAVCLGPAWRIGAQAGRGMPLRAGCHIERGPTRDDDPVQDHRRRLLAA